MSIEEEYRKTTRGLGPLFLATLLMLAALVFYLALRQRGENAGTLPQPASMKTVPASGVA